MDGYDAIANNLVQGNGYRFEANTSETMMREPGYPLFLAFAFKIGGYHVGTVRWANWLLTIGIAFLMMRLTQVVTNDRTVSLIATLLFLFYPSTLISEARAGVEIFFTLIVLVFMLSLHHAVAKGNRWRYLVAGLALGVAVQVRSTPLVFPFFLLLYLLVFASGTTERVKAFMNVAVLVLGMTIVMVPWVVLEISCSYISLCRPLAFKDLRYKRGSTPASISHLMRIFMQSKVKQGSRGLR